MWEGSPVLAANGLVEQQVVRAPERVGIPRLVVIGHVEVRTQLAVHQQIDFRLVPLHRPNVELFRPRLPAQLFQGLPRRCPFLLVAVGMEHIGQEPAL